MLDTVLSVSDCVALVNQTLEYAYPSIIVEGEVASFKVNKAKYVFFDLKDEEAALNCFMMAYQLRMPLEDGMKVRVIAQPRLTAWGKFSLTVRDIRPVGEGSIKRSFQMLKAKLEKEGLFDASRKRHLPQMPERVGLIASVESAGYADFVKILQSRWGGLELLVANVQVQGAGASNQIMQALQYFNEHATPVDVIVLVRGGGSAEDLSVFNDEPLVRTVAASRIPTLVGVGHEVDTSLCDLAADLRAATPSNAAHLLVPDKSALLRELEHKQRAMMNRLEHRSQAVHQVIINTANRLLGSMQQTLAAQQRHVAYAEALMRQLNPKTVLRRGYSLVRTEQGSLITSAMQVSPGDHLAIETKDAIINVGVEHVRRTDQNA